MANVFQRFPEYPKIGCELPKRFAGMMSARLEAPAPDRDGEDRFLGLRYKRRGDTAGARAHENSQGRRQRRAQLQWIAARLVSRKSSPYRLILHLQFAV